MTTFGANRAEWVKFTKRSLPKLIYKKAALIALILLTFSSLAPKAKSDEIEEKLKQTQSMIAALHVPDRKFAASKIRIPYISKKNNELNEGFCTGFVARIPNTQNIRYVTAAHCANSWREAGSPDFAVKIDDGVIDLGEYGLINENSFESNDTIKYSEYGDIAEINVPFESFKFSGAYELASEPPKVGETLVMTGYPQGKGPFFFECLYVGKTVSNYNRDEKDKRNSMVPTMICPTVSKTETIQGLSGGPILNSKGQVVGVLHAQGLDFVQKRFEDDKVDYVSAPTQDVFFTQLTQAEWSDPNSLYVPPNYNGKFKEVIVSEVTGAASKLAPLEYSVKDGWLHGDLVIQLENATRTDTYENGILKSSQTVIKIPVLGTLSIP